MIKEFFFLQEKEGEMWKVDVIMFSSSFI